MDQISEQGLPHQVVTIPCITIQHGVEPKIGIENKYFFKEKKSYILQNYKYFVSPISNR